MFLRKKYTKNGARRGRRKDKNNLSLDYQNLEARQLLAVDIGVNFTGSTYLTDSTALNPEAHGDIGPNHYIEVVSGRFNAHNRFTGNRVMTMTLDDFFTSAGGTVFTPTHTPRVAFDHISERWFVAAIGEGLGNWVHVAFSNTSDPTDGWQQLQFVADSTGVHFNDNLTLAVDADAIYMTTDNFSDFVPDDSSIYSIPKADMFLPDPTLTNMSRFEGLSWSEYGRGIQVASNFDASDGKAVAIGSLSTTTKVYLEITGAGALGATLSDPSEFNVDFGVNNDEHIVDIAHDEYIDDLGEFYEQPFNPIQEANPFGPSVAPELGLVGSIYEANGKVFAAQTVGVQGVAFYTAINWFEVDTETQLVAEASPIDNPVFEGNIYQNERAENLLDPFVVGYRGPASHLIRPEPIEDAVDDGFEYLFSPSIAVTNEGLVAVSYNRISQDNPISTGVVAGTYVNGVDRHNVQMEGLFEVQNGFETYDLNTTGVDLWSSGSIKVDPLGYNQFFVTQPWANTTDRWSIQNTQIALVDMNPIIEGDRSNNFIVMRRSAADTNLVEIEIDGVVTDVFPYSALGRVEVWAGEGSDTFFIDYSNGDPVPEGGFLFDGGQGPDLVETNNPNGSEFVMTQPIHPTHASNFPDYLSQYQIRFSDDPTVSDGFYRETSELVDVEELRGGPGDDTFVFRGNWTMGGSANGQGGDDTFQFIDEPFPFQPINPPNFSGVEENIIGGPGYDTIDFEGRLRFTRIELIGFGASGGFDGRVLGEPNEDLPIGGDIFQPDDVFREIERALGSSNHLTDELTFQDDLAGTFFIDDANSHYITDNNGQDQRFDFYQWNFVNASNLVDTFNVWSNTVNPLHLNALDGDDVYTFSSTAPDLNGTTENIQDLIRANAGPGENKIFASNIGGSAVDALILAARVSGIGEFVYTAIGGSVDMEVWATPFDDYIAVHSYLPDNTLVVRSFDGDDEFSIQDLSRAMVDIYGGDGDDTYVIERIQGVSFRNLSIIDSVDAEMDRVILAGTVLNETFTITANTFIDLDFDVTGIEIFGIEGRGGNDTFNILDYEGDLFVDGGDGDDIFNFSSDGAGLQGSLDGFLTTTITVEGGLGRNQINVSDFASLDPLNAVVREDRITGLWDGRLLFQSTGGSFSRPGDIGGINVRGSDVGDDTIDIAGILAENTVGLEGVGGNDTFFVRAAAVGNARTNGGDGFDNHHIFFGGTDGRQVQVVDDAAPSLNRLNFYGTDNDDIFEVFSDAIRYSAEMVTLTGDFATLSAFGFGGNDQMIVDGTRAQHNTFHGHEGDDVFTSLVTVGAQSMRIVLGDGNDKADLKGTDEDTHTTVLGGLGDDIMVVTKGTEGTVLADGEEGSDRYNVNFSATRQRYVDTRDSGTTGQDIVSIRGTVIADEIELRANRVIRINEVAALGDETVVFDTSNEVVIVNTLDGQDKVDVFASVAPTTRIQTGNDDDTISIYSTAGVDQMTIDAGEHDDLVNIYRSSATSNVGIFGRGGDDEFVIGSNLADDNGNLGFIRGRIGVFGGDSTVEGEDALYVNDTAGVGGYAYYVSPTAIRSIPGPFNAVRNTFAGVVYDGSMEFVRLDTTEANNYVSVGGSMDTRFHIDGNGESTPFGDVINLIGSADDGRNLTTTGPGEGFWDFTDGTQDVAFEGFEGIFDAGTE